MITATLLLLFAGVSLPAAPATAPAVQLGDPNTEAGRKLERELQEHERRIEAQREAMLARKGRIQAELAARPDAAPSINRLNREWAGTYASATSSHLHRLWIAPENGAVLEKSIPGGGCMVCVGDDINPYLNQQIRVEDHGEFVEVHPDGLRIQWTVDPSLDSGSALQGRLYFVLINGVRAIRSDRDMCWLVNELNAGTTSTTMLAWGFRRLNDDGTAPRFGDDFKTVALPEPWFGRILTGAAEFKVTAATPAVVGKYSRLPSECRVTLEGGSDRGAYVGMRFDTNTADGKPTALTIDSVAEHSCEGRLAITTFMGGPLTPPAPGTAFKLPGPTATVSRLITDR